MKYIMTFFFIMVVMLGYSKVISQEQNKFLRNRRICVRRDTATIKGKVISYYWRNGKPDTLAPAVVTNDLKDVNGKYQNNPLEVELAPLRKAMDDAAKARRKDVKNFSKWLDDTIKARDKSTTEITNFYNDILFIATNRNESF